MRIILANELNLLFDDFFSSAKAILQFAKSIRVHCHSKRVSLRGCIFDTFVCHPGYQMARSKSTLGYIRETETYVPCIQVYVGI